MALQYADLKPKDAQQVEGVPVTLLCARRAMDSDAVTLIDDFFDEVERVLRERGIKTAVVSVEEKGQRK